MSATAPVSVCDQSERSRGRAERRRVEVYTAPAWQSDWPAIGRAVRVVRSGVRDGKAYEQTWLYLTSRTDDAGALGAAIRSHWHVENRLHWCKDVLMNEDTGGVVSKAGAAMLSALRGIALSVLRHDGEWSPTEARSRFANRVPQMLRLLRT